MKRLLIIIFFVPVVSFSQSSTAFWSLGFAASGLNYTGEVAEGGDVGTWINEMRPGFSLNLRRHFNFRTAWGFEAGWGKVYAADENRGNQMRNFVVNTQLAQINTFFEINFKRFGKYYQRNGNTPFIKFGGGILFYTPYLNTNAEYPPIYALYPGSDATYNLEAAFGWKWRTSYHTFISLDFHYNATGTSHLEGFDLVDFPNPIDAFYGLRLTYAYGFFN